MACLLRRTLVFLVAGLSVAVLAGQVLLGTPDTTAPQTPAPSSAAGSLEPGSARDVAAAKDALDGWWTKSQKTRDERLEWWREARFGCFIHWGVYSGPAGEWEGKNAGGYAEHLMRHERIPLAEYKQKVVAPFNPVKFNAEEWVRLIKGAGMKYVVITAKHHDGFAMWPSEVTKYNIRDATKFARDPMKELSDACRRNGLRFGFYYSHAYDWEDPNAPGNDWDYQNPGGDKKLFGGANWYDEHPEVLARVRRYVDGKAIPQLKELIAKYHPDIFWFDTSGKLPLSEQLRIVEAVRKTDHNVVINGRAARGLGRNFGDYLDTADRPAELRPTLGDWECIPTTNESYGYHKLDHSHKPVAYFIRLLAKAAAKGGNVLLNIGPMGDGEIAPEDQAILRGIGDWMAVNGESIHRSHPMMDRTPLERQAWGESTYWQWRERPTEGRPFTFTSMLFLHVFDWPSDGRLVLGGLETDVTSAFLLADSNHERLKTERLGQFDTLVHVPGKAPDAVDSVVALLFEDRWPPRIMTHSGRLLDPQLENRLLAFDGEAHGKGFKYGDGKAANYYVSGFKRPTDSISWKARLNEPATFEVAVKYRAASAENGSYRLKFGDQTLETQVEPTPDKKRIETAKLGHVKLPAGEFQIILEPTKIDGADLMQFFEIDLTPAK